MNENKTKENGEGIDHGYILSYLYQDKEYRSLYDAQRDAEAKIGDRVFAWIPGYMLPRRDDWCASCGDTMVALGAGDKPIPGTEIRFLLNGHFHCEKHRQ